MDLGVLIILKYDYFYPEMSFFINNSLFLNNTAQNYLLYFDSIGTEGVSIHLYNTLISNCYSQEQVYFFFLQILNLRILFES